jgi:hypothetical protein
LKSRGEKKRKEEEEEEDEKEPPFIKIPLMFGPILHYVPSI